MSDRVTIFDTTLRDGEQSPGCSMHPAEKLELARQLARLGVDVIEAGFPVASPGDFEAVRTIAERGAARPTVAALVPRQARATSTARRHARWRARRARRASTSSSPPPPSTSSTSCA